MYLINKHQIIGRHYSQQETRQVLRTTTSYHGEGIFHLISSIHQFQGLGEGTIRACAPSPHSTENVQGGGGVGAQQCLNK